MLCDYDSLSLTADRQNYEPRLHFLEEGFEAGVEANPPLTRECCQLQQGNFGNGKPPLLLRAESTALVFPGISDHDLRIKTMQSAQILWALFLSALGLIK
jgi:hypothetical protein